MSVCMRFDIRQIRERALIVAYLFACFISYRLNFDSFSTCLDRNVFKLVHRPLICV